MDKSRYIFISPTCSRAHYWFEKVLARFAREVKGLNVSHRTIEFKDSIFTFLSENQHSEIRGLEHLKDTTVYPEEAIYIILDDPERFRKQGSS